MGPGTTATPVPLSERGVVIPSTTIKIGGTNWNSRAVKEACSELVPKMVGEKNKLTAQVVETQFSCREKGPEGNWTAQSKKEKPGSRVAVAVTVTGPDVVPTCTSPKSTDDGEKLIDIAWVVAR
jgi:hypothetical protein